MEEFLNSPLLAEVQFWSIWVVLAIAAWYAIPERVRGWLLRAGRYLVWLIELLGAGGLWLLGVIWNLLRQVVWGNPQTLQASAAGADQPAPVSRVRVPLPGSYVQAYPPPTLSERQTDPASVCLSAPSEPEEPPVPPALRALMLDSELKGDARRAATSREAVIAGLLASNWGDSEIRDVVKGDNNAFAQALAAARARLVQPTPAPRQTPVAGRELPAHAEFRPVE